jgi:hypothetical protein
MRPVPSGEQLYAGGLSAVPQRLVPEAWLPVPESQALEPLPPEEELAAEDRLPEAAAEPPEIYVLAVRSWLTVLILLAGAVFMARGLIMTGSFSPAEASFFQAPAGTAVWPETEVIPAADSGPGSSGNLSGSGPVSKFTKSDLAARLGLRPLIQPDFRFLEIKSAAGPDLYAETTLDPDLQSQAVQWLRRTGAQKAALAVLNPLDGEVLALAGWPQTGETANWALSESFPAASLFKIVTAAAAVEEARLTAESEVAYDGGKHTLFKANVSKTPDQGRHRTTLKEGFAESINTVFGKLGAYTLGPKSLADFAEKFRFNQPIEFEMPVAVSQFESGDQNDLFHTAELASGFNRQTRTTPLHGALLSSAVISGGVLFEPTLVREVFDRDNNVYYRSQPKNLGRVIASGTARELSELMQAAVTLGTGRKHFADAENHPLLSDLVIGGKSGTINDEAGRRVEWFTAFSYWPEPGSGQMVWPLAMAAVVVRDGRTAVDSQELIRQALIAYYQPLLDGTGRKFR